VATSAVGGSITGVFDAYAADVCNRLGGASTSIRSGNGGGKELGANDCRRTTLLMGARERDLVSGFHPANAKRGDGRGDNTKLIGDCPLGILGSPGDGGAGWAVRPQRRRRYTIFGSSRHPTMMRTTPETAQHHPVLRSLAKRWCKQRKGQEEQQ
jgi:hypothetical protein